MRFHVFTPALALGLLACAVSAQGNGYSHDDGSSESALGVGPGPNDVLWMQRYDTRAFGGAPSDVITSIEAAFGDDPGPSSPPAGTPIVLLVYEDVDDDMAWTAADDRPPVSRVAGVITLPDTGVKTSFPIPPAPVSGSFFVGVVSPVDGSGTNNFPAPMDRSRPSLTRAWLAYAPGGGGTTQPPSVFPYHAPSTAVFPPQDMDGLGAGFGAVWLLDCTGQGPAGTSYCTTKINSLGCAPVMSYAGAPSASGAGSFLVRCDAVLNNKPGLFFYAVDGAQANLPFQGGTLCVGPAGIRRTPASSSGGNPSPAIDCSGAYVLDFNAFTIGAAGGHPSPALATMGAVVHAQAWGRDQGFPAPQNTMLSDGLEWTQGA